MSERISNRLRQTVLASDGVEAPEDMELHDISTLLIQEDNLDTLYSRILDAATGLMSSDMASMQLLDPETNRLWLLASKGFHPQSAAFWEWVCLDSASTCGLALTAGLRVIVSDTETCNFMVGTADLDEYRRSSIRAVQSTPLVSRSGQLLGMISTHWRETHKPPERRLRRLDVLARQAADLIERNRTESALRESNDQLLRLASIVETSDDAIITKDLDGVISSWNRSAERIFGYTAAEVIGKSVTILIPPGRDDEEPAVLARIRRGEHVDHYESVRRCKDGRMIDISITISPLKNAQGKIVGASKIARDITKQKQNDERIAVLAREAEHRTKNILATVQATVNLSCSDTADGLKLAIEGRIQALARLHDLFVKSNWSGARLSSIAAQELSPYCGDGNARVQINGPDVLLAPNSAQAIGVILHELATNAVKYGALSVPEGKVEITWLEAADERLVLHWTESRGPMVRMPERRGFGAVVIERMMREQGAIHFDWRPEGLACEIVLHTPKL